MKVRITVNCQLKITRERATQETSENPTKIGNKLQKHWKKLRCNTVRSINVYFHFFEMIETILIEEFVQLILRGREYSAEHVCQLYWQWTVDRQ